MRIVVLDWNTMTANGDLSPDELQQFGEVEIFALTKPEEAAERIGNADIVLCNKVPITKEVMDSCPNLKYIGLFATGFNNVDIGYAAQKGIIVCNAGQYSTSAVAQQVFAYILDHFSRIREYDSSVKNGDWEHSAVFSYFPVPTRELSGKTLSVIGFGSIGRRVAEIGNAFGMNVIVSTRTAPDSCDYELTDIKTAAERADVLTFHCPLTEKTAGIVNDELLSHMKSSAILINTSRGGVVNEASLAEALNSGKIAAAYLDVLAVEPMSPETPLKSAKNCIITPHTSWAALETRQRLMSIVAENLKAWLIGKPQNKVN